MDKKAKAEAKRIRRNQRKRDGGNDSSEPLNPDVDGASAELNPPDDEPAIGSETKEA